MLDLDSVQETNVVQVVDEKTVCVQEHTNDLPNVFTFDSVLDTNADQLDVYERVGSKALSDFFKGFNGTILAYGQTGSGKSYTMMGEGPNSKGLIPRISENIFTLIAESSEEVEYTVGLSMMEVYKEHIIDLLDPHAKSKDYVIQEDKLNGIHVRGLSHAFVSSAAEMAGVLKEGCRNRRTTATNMNTESSRSHMISEVLLTQKDVRSGEIRKSHLFLVDLAGSEKVDRSGASGVTLDETKKINLSLSVLGLVINSLTDPKVSHVPYRDSKLTRILQESLGGNSRTTLIINISPTSGSHSETLSTLRFGSRAKKIRNSVHINTELSVDQLKGRIAMLEKRNRELEEELEQYTHIDGASAQTMERLRMATASSTSSPLQVRNKLSNSSFHDQRLARLPMTPDSLVSFQDELRRKDDKISQLELELLALKMANLTSLHNEDLKLFKLECALHKLNDKLSDVELINTNLRRHLQVSEKIITARGAKIDKLRELVAEQQEQVKRESVYFESKLKVLKDKFDSQKHRNSNKHYSNGSLEDTLEAELDQGPLHQTPKRNIIRPVGLEAESPSSPKMGLNLRIVKPLRGGVKTSDL